MFSNSDTIIWFQRKRSQDNGRGASFNLCQPRYKYSPSLGHYSNFECEKIQRLKSCCFFFFSENNNKPSADSNTSTIFIIKFCEFIFEWSIYLQMYVLAWWRPQSIFIFLGLRDHWWKKIPLIWNKLRKIKDWWWVCNDRHCTEKQFAAFWHKLPFFFFSPDL